MNRTFLISIFAFIGATAVHTVQAQTYDPHAVEVINNLIANNGLQATPNAPETWEFAAWNKETPKQIIELELSASHTGNTLTGNASFAGLTTLQKLGIMYNNLTKIDVKNCIQLRVFASRDNPLTGIDLTTCTQLQILTFTNTNVPSLDLTKCTQLEYIECQGNQLSKLDVTKCTQLQLLGCPRNELIELDLRGLDKLTEFFGSEQYPRISLCKNETEEYTCLISLNNPTFDNSAISYSDGILKSTDKNVSYTRFTVQTTKEGFELSGEMKFTYTEVGINTVDSVKIEIYPNPTNYELRIMHYELRIKDIEIFDISGKSVYSSFSPSSHSSITTINISNLTSGIYVIKITTEAGEVIKKFIKE